MSRRRPMRVSAGPDRPEIVFAVSADLHPTLQPGVAGVVLLVVIPSPIRLINPKDKSLGRRFPVRLKNLARDHERLARLVLRRDDRSPRKFFRRVAGAARRAAAQGRGIVLFRLRPQAERRDYESEGEGMEFHSAKINRPSSRAESNGGSRAQSRDDCRTHRAAERSIHLASKRSHPPWSGAPDPPGSTS